jgi:hypothetical protein
LLAAVLLPLSEFSVSANDCDARRGQCAAGRDPQNCLADWLTCKGMDSNELLFVLARKFTDTPLISGILRTGVDCVAANRACIAECDNLLPPDVIRNACWDRCRILRDNYCPTRSSVPAPPDIREAAPSDATVTCPPPTRSSGTTPRAGCR